METNQLETNNLTEELKLQPQAEGFLKETTKWAKFLAILSFIGLGFVVIVSFFSIIALSSVKGTLGLLAGIFILGILGFSIYLAYLLFKFASETSLALRNRDTYALTRGLQNLKSYYKLTGIMTIIVISVYIIYFIAIGFFITNTLNQSTFHL